MSALPTDLAATFIMSYDSPNSYQPLWRTPAWRTAAFAVASLLSHGAFAQAISLETLTAAVTPAVRINEVLATAAATGSDLIELHNAGATEANISGWSLADATTIRPFIFPEGTRIAANGFLLVYAGGTPPSTAQHRASFALDSEGDEVRLFNTAGQLVDSIRFGFQIPNFSIARTGAAGEIWALTTPSFGTANTARVALGNPAELRINEWASSIRYRLDDEMIELYNPSAAPVALGGMHLIDDPTRLTKDHLEFRRLSFIAASGFLALYRDKFEFGLDADGDRIVLLGANLQTVDDISFTNQATDASTGRLPDGGPARQHFSIPTPGLRNDSVLPAAYDALLKNLRITEVMYLPSGTSGTGDYDFIELQNIGSTVLDLGGVRFTNGLRYTFQPGTTLAPNAFTVVAQNSTKFRERYPSAAAVLAAGSFVEGDTLDDQGERIALTLPAPWDVHILSFRFEPAWYFGTSGDGYSLVVPNPTGTRAVDWGERSSWRASSQVHGSPGVADRGGTTAPGAWLSNLSVRARLSADPLIVGLVLEGPKDILVRAAGPALAAFVPGHMVDPRLDLYRDSAIVFSNDNWGATGANLAAFPFMQGSLDAAFVQRLAGAHTVHANGTGPGVVLVEAYDQGATSTQRLINVSARSWAGTGDDILIAGFTISGAGRKRVLVRAVGPGLTTLLDITDFLVDPRLEIYSSANVKIADDNNWSASLAATFTAVNAFALPAGSKDAALIVELPAGNYTAQVKGADGGTGQAVVEVYEVP